MKVNEYVSEFDAFFGKLLAEHPELVELNAGVRQKTLNEG